MGRKRRAGAIFGAMAFVAATGTAAAVVGASPANAAVSLCGPGYVADGSATVTDGKTVLGTMSVTWNKKLQANCAVFLKKDTSSKTSMLLRIYDKDKKVAPAVAGKSNVDKGSFSTYAGPVYAHAPGCLLFDYDYGKTHVVGKNFKKWGCGAAAPGPSAPAAPGSGSGSSSGSSGSSGGSASGGSTTPSGSEAGWKLVMQEDFNTLDTGRWEVYDGPGNAGIGLRRPSQVKAQNGVLVITAKGMTSGGIGLKQSQTYGRYEFRAKSNVSHGSWSNVLLWPDNDGWGGGELDMAENSSKNGSNTYLHPTSGGDSVSKHYDGDFTQWHTWQFDWLASGITVKIDGKQVYKGAPKGFAKSAGLAIQLDIDDGSLGVTSPKPAADTVSTFTVDWVKVYKKA